jgi:hypothetical protein
LKAGEPLAMAGEPRAGHLSSCRVSVDGGAAPRTTGLAAGIAKTPRSARRLLHELVAAGLVEEDRW